MPARRSRCWRSGRGRGCARKASRRRWIRSAASSRAWSGACPSAARSSPIPPASNSRCSTPIRAGSSGCACACRLPRRPRGIAAMTEPALLRIQPGARVETPLVRFAQQLGGMVGWRRYGLAFLFGVSAAGALPPIDLTPLLAVAFPGLLWLDEGSAGPGASFALGWAFGCGFFLAGLYWIAAALFVDLRDFWWLVPVAALGLPVVLALYSGAPAAGGAGVRLRDLLDHRRMDPGPRLYRVSVEPDRLRLGGRLSRCSRDARKRRLDRHLRALADQRARRLSTDTARHAPAGAGGAKPAPGARHRRGAADPRAGHRRSRPARTRARRRHRDLAASGAALRSRAAEMEPRRRPQQFRPPDRAEPGAVGASARSRALAGGGGAVPDRA